MFYKTTSHSCGSIISAKYSLAMASDNSTKLQLQLTDVYEIAEKVGEQFEQLIKQFGSVHMGTVIPMVISSLEHLEQFVEDHQRLEISNRKLLLQVDSLAQEREQRIMLSDKVDEEQCKLEAEREDKKRLAMRIERLLMRNEDLAKQLDRMKGNSLKPVPRGQDPLNASCSEEQKRSNSVSSMMNETSLDFYPNGSLVAANGPDRLQFPRMSKRLSQVELELQKTRRKLVEAHHGLQTSTAENRALKAQLDESKAEAALSTLEISSSSGGSSKDGHPKFYKEDLLAVLRERNELKEELDGMREELQLAKNEIKQLQLYSPRHASTNSLPGYFNTRARSTTRVREILDSITESLTSADQPETIT